MSDSVLPREGRTLVTAPYEAGAEYAPVEIREPAGRHLIVRWNGGAPEETELE